MGIYLPNIEMPKEGDFIVIRSDGKAYYVSTNPQNAYEREVVPVSPHGRLGDLDVLAKQVEYERFHHAHTDSLAARHHIAEYGHFLKEISNTPTIIPANEEGE